MFFEAKGHAVTIQQKRKNFMESIRRKTRFRIINQKRTSPTELKHGDLDLKHLSEYKEKNKLIPLIKQYLELKPSLEDLVQVRRMIQNPSNM